MTRKKRKKDKGLVDNAMEHADSAQGGQMEGMIPALPRDELSWILGKAGSSSREGDVKKMGVNQHGQESNDYNGRGDNTDGDDGRGTGGGTTRTPG